MSNISSSPTLTLEEAPKHDTRKDEFQCPDCGRMFKWRQNFVNHTRDGNLIKVKNEGKPLIDVKGLCSKCFECNIMFRRRTELRKHQKEVHSQQHEESGPNSKGIRPLSFPKGNEMSNSSSLEDSDRVVKGHQGADPSQMSAVAPCPSSIHRGPLHNTNLQADSDMHSGDDYVVGPTRSPSRSDPSGQVVQLQCEICNESFRNDYSLNRHLTRNLRKYPCLSP